MDGGSLGTHMLVLESLRRWPVSEGGQECTQRVQVLFWHIHRPQSHDTVTVTPGGPSIYHRPT